MIHFILLLCLITQDKINCRKYLQSTKMKTVIAFVVSSFLSITCFSQNKLSAFPLSSVQLLNSPFRKAQDADLQYMLQLDPDRLLAPFLKEAGIQPKKENYGNWESSGLDGHIPIDATE